MPGFWPAAARTHLRSDEPSARPGLQLALATLALAVEELLRDLALVAAGHWPVGAQFPLAPRPTLAAPGPAGREVAQVVVIQAIVELLLGAHGRPPLGRLRPDLSLGGAEKDRVHCAGPQGLPPARALLEAPVPRFDWLCQRGRGLGMTSQSLEGVANEAPRALVPGTVTLPSAPAGEPPARGDVWQNPTEQSVSVGQNWKTSQVWTVRDSLKNMHSSGGLLSAVNILLGCLMIGEKCSITM